MHLCRDNNRPRSRYDEFVFDNRRIDFAEGDFGCEGFTVKDHRLNVSVTTRVASVRTTHTYLLHLAHKILFFILQTDQFLVQSVYFWSTLEKLVVITSASVSLAVLCAVRVGMSGVLEKCRACTVHETSTTMQNVISKHSDEYKCH